MGNYDQRLTEIKHHQMNQDSEIEIKYKLENQRLQQQVSELTSQLNQFDASKRFENERNFKDRNVYEEEINKLTNNLSLSNKNIESLKSKINELNSDCQTMQRMYKLQEENNEKLKIEIQEKNIELQNTLSQSNTFQTSNFELALQVKQLEEELARVGQSKETIDNAKSELLQKFNEYGNVVQKE